MVPRVSRSAYSYQTAGARISVEGSRVYGLYLGHKTSGSMDQVGHSYVATTAIYISVGDDFKDRLVRAAIDEQTGADRRSNTASRSEHAAASDGVWAWVPFGA